MGQRATKLGTFARDGAPLVHRYALAEGDRAVLIVAGGGAGLFDPPEFLVRVTAGQVDAGFGHTYRSARFDEPASRGTIRVWASGSGMAVRVRPEGLLRKEYDLTCECERVRCEYAASALHHPTTTLQ